MTEIVQTYREKHGDKWYRALLDDLISLECQLVMMPIGTFSISEIEDAMQSATELYDAVLDVMVGAA